MAIKLIDPLDILQYDLPLWVLSDDTQGFISWGIRWKSKGQYNHIMLMIEPGILANQVFTYRTMPINVYMKPRYRLKFWQNTALDTARKRALLDRVQEELNEPWYKKLYDYPGILGQALSLRWINTPWANYCSEREAEYLKYVGIDISSIGPRPTPQDIDNLFQQLPFMRVYGYYFCG